MLIRLSESPMVVCADTFVEVEDGFGEHWDVNSSIALSGEEEVVEFEFWEASEELDQGE